MALEVFKFGGASVKNATAIDNVVKILDNHAPEKTIVVVSAMGKTTNAMEGVVNAFYNQTGEASALLSKIKNDHFQVIKDLDIATPQILAEINDTFVEIDWLIEDEVHDGYDYIYDQIVSVGELVSSKILAAYCQHKGVNSTWLDIRDVLFTNDNYREAKVDWEYSQPRIQKKIEQLLEQKDIVITQGFIASNRDNNTTTLGREGSDYTAAILSYCTDATSMNIWKDVPGILTADPKKFENVLKIDRLDYREAIEMTYFGAKVIHPKTIKPIQNKNIPLFVRPFQNPADSGTVIADEFVESYPPVIVLESGQMLIHIATKDFSFVVEEHLSEIFSKLNTYHVKVNMMRNTAISFSICTLNEPKRIQKFIDDLGEKYNIRTEQELELITIRNYDEDTIARMKKGNMVLFEETIGKTHRMAVRPIPLMERK